MSDQKGHEVDEATEKSGFFQRNWNNNKLLAARLFKIKSGWSVAEETGGKVARNFKHDEFSVKCVVYLFNLKNLFWWSFFVKFQTHDVVPNLFSEHVFSISWAFDRRHTEHNTQSSLATGWQLRRRRTIRVFSFFQTPHVEHACKNNTTTAPPHKNFIVDESPSLEHRKKEKQVQHTSTWYNIYRL